MSGNKNQWPKEMLHPQFLPGQLVRVHGLRNVLHGHVLGKEVAYGGNGSTGTVTGMLVTEGTVLYHIHFDHPNHEHGFTAGLPVNCLAKLDVPELCGTCIFWNDSTEECDDLAEVKGGKCSSYQTFEDDVQDDDWEESEDDSLIRCDHCLYHTGSDCDAESNFYQDDGEGCDRFEEH